MKRKNIVLLIITGIVVIFTFMIRMLKNTTDYLHVTRFREMEGFNYDED